MRDALRDDFSGRVGGEPGIETAELQLSSAKGLAAATERPFILVQKAW